MELGSYGWTEKVLEIPQVYSDRQKHLHTDTGSFLSEKITPVITLPKNKKNAGFTLIEVLVSVVLSGILLTSAFASFQGILKSQVRLSGSINIQRNLFYLNEKISSLIRDGGSLDYEEYFNRRILGYEKSLSDEGWTYSTTSHYGNGDNPNGEPIHYICGIENGDSGDEGEGCLNGNHISPRGANPIFSESLGDNQMAYGQYSELGVNHGSLAGFATPMKLPPIFPINNLDLRDKGMGDLYLIKKLPDNSFERTYFRHIYIQDPSRSTPVCDPETSMTGCLGKIQITRLVSCDTLPSSGDGIIDAWAPHTDFGGEENPCESIDSVNKISGAADTLVWADISSPDMNVIHAGFLPFPLKIPRQMSGAGEEAFSPVVQIHLEVTLSQKIIARGLIQESENTPRMITTLFDLDTL
ncbi:type II secretion system protein [Candidatus Gracilibacteria bacterium]|nr:type II secretion system protein [Candidatus Gracilibacteria bacterium]